MRIRLSLIRLALLTSMLIFASCQNDRPNIDPIAEGNSALTDGDFTAALRFFETAVTAQPENPNAFFGRGSAYYGRYQKAYSKKSADADPADFYRAITNFTKTIELDPSNAPAYYFRGLTFAAFEERGHALADYDHALRINPNYDIVYYGRAYLHFETKEYEKAAADYEKFINLGKDQTWIAQAKIELERVRSLAAKDSAEQLTK